MMNSLFQKENNACKQKGLRWLHDVTVQEQDPQSLTISKRRYVDSRAFKSFSTSIPSFNKLEDAI